MPSVHNFFYVCGLFSFPFSTQLTVKLSCKCGITIPGARLKALRVLAKTSIWQFLAVSGEGRGLHLAASGNDVRSRVPTYGMPDTSARSGEWAAAFHKFHTKN